MSQRPLDGEGGIFRLFFREAGLFWEQAFKWAEEQAAEDRRELAQDTERRKADAAARLLEQARLAKEAGLNVDEIMALLKK
jgi:hypothetical protein